MSCNGATLMVAVCKVPPPGSEIWVPAQKTTRPFSSSKNTQSRV
jgi:hypothetical protein